MLERGRPASSTPGGRSVEIDGCTIDLRRVAGPVATELFLHARPPVASPGPGAQAQAIYRSLARVLATEGGGLGAVAVETVFLRRSSELEAVRSARDAIFAAHGCADHRPASTEIEQPPLAAHAAVEVMLHAVLPRTPEGARTEVVTTPAVCGCEACTRAHGLVLRLGEETRFHAGGLCGAGADAYEQTLAMFTHAEQLLQQVGMRFTDVVRTWIHLRHMERDYAAFNRARREFFRRLDVGPVPASTGIWGAPASTAHDLCLGVYAVKSCLPVVRTLMSSPTLNEAGEYGADFARGMRVAESNRVALHVSGTASIDERGATVHAGDFDAQARRMLRNVAALLEQQGANFGHVVSAITYLKHPADADRLRDLLRATGFDGFPHALVEAAICRPELLCETEALAVLPARPRTPGLATSPTTPEYGAPP